MQLGDAYILEVQGADHGLNTLIWHVVKILSLVEIVLGNRFLYIFASL